MDFTLHKDHVVTSTKGHTIRFIKGEPVNVPREMHAEVMAVGAVPSDEIVEPKKPDSNEPDNPDDRKQAILTGMTMLAEQNKRDDFTGTGVPTSAALQGVLGFKIDTKERDALWTEYMQSRG